MVRNIRWDKSVRENVLNLVEALLKQADNELDDSALKAAVDVEWVTENSRSAKICKLWTNISEWLD